MTNPAFIPSFAGKRVLVTGHTGFKGAWLCYWLHLMGARVTGYSLEPPTQPSLFQSIKLGSLVNDVRGDILDADKLAQTFAETQPEYVFHLAAQALVRLSYAEPAATYAANVMGTINVLEAARTTPGVRVVMNITSDKCYENREWVWGYRECDPMGGHDPYSSSKGCAELVAQAYSRSFFNQPDGPLLASVRAGNVIGGGDWAADRLVPDCIKALQNGQEIVLRSPLAVRPWQHVLEPLSGYLTLAARIWDKGQDFSGGWNFGPDPREQWTVEQVVNGIVNLWGSGSYSVTATPQPHEAHMLKLDCSKANSLLGWQPRWNVQKALEVTVEWYRAHGSNQNPELLRDVCRRQITDHSSRSDEEAGT
ncbi:MAG: CDP-glucose 4,6-dehydratase [Okeania sp. SIO3B3]|nr:CDP-glucose 4,6-dehydratase [Okeania sp. SIO3B3]